MQMITVLYIYQSSSSQSSSVDSSSPSSSSPNNPFSPHFLKIVIVTTLIRFNGKKFRGPRPNPQLFANPPAQSMMASDYFIFFQVLEVRDVFFAQLFFQFCNPLFKIARNSIYLCLMLFWVFVWGLFHSWK